MTGSRIHLDRVAFAYGDARFLFDVVFEPGVITALMGSSGSGKSTLLNLIAGFERPLSGQVIIGDADVSRLSPSQRPVSMIFQENNLFSHMSVAQNVGLGRSPSLKLSSSDRHDVNAALERVGLTGKEQRLPGELSGGERQRVALARVLVRDRSVLLLDEPFASLGPALRDDMIALVSELHAEKRMTVVFVTHHPEDARKAASRMVFLDKGQVSAVGAMSDFDGPGAPQAFRDYIGARTAAR